MHEVDANPTHQTTPWSLCYATKPQASPHECINDMHTTHAGAYTQHVQSMRWCSPNQAICMQLQASAFTVHRSSSLNKLEPQASRSTKLTGLIAHLSAQDLATSPKHHLTIICTKLPLGNRNAVQTRPNLSRRPPPPQKAACPTRGNGASCPHARPSHTCECVMCLTKRLSPQCPPA